MSPFSSNFMHHAHMPADTCHAAHTHIMNWCKHTQICTYQQKQTHKWLADISEELQRIQGVESHLVKEDQTAGNENHWPSLVTEFTICAWNQSKEERKQRKLAGEGNVWASINRPTFEMILKGMQSFIIQLILLRVYHIETVKEACFLTEAPSEPTVGFTVCLIFPVNKLIYMWQAMVQHAFFK